MNFVSLEFLIFFPIVATVYFLLPMRCRWAWLLAASYYFYMAWSPKYVILIIASTIVDYGAGVFIADAPTRARKRLLLSVSIAMNLGLLLVFKYFNFIAESATAVMRSFGSGTSISPLHLLLPVGLSFYTFQSLSYVIDVYRGTQRAERHLGRFALYLAFFPQLVAGPIERASRLLPQFREEHAFDYHRITSGLKLMALGFLKKAVIADRLAIIVDRVYSAPDQFGGIATAIATIAFGYQIYCDFSGYSDIARGAARVMGFRLMVNFDRPYASSSIAEFWRRWHISLCTWFRDYVYIPLGGNRVTPARQYINIFTVFLISGLWHGAQWTFVFWGALHGAFMVIAAMTVHHRARVLTWLRLSTQSTPVRLLRVISTFLLVHVAWIFFRANSFGDARTIIANLSTSTGWRTDFAGLQQLPTLLGTTVSGLLILLVLLCLLEGIQFLHRDGGLGQRLSLQPAYIRWPIYYGAVLAILFLGKFDQSPFLYFQF